MTVQVRANNANLPLCLDRGKIRDDKVVKTYATGALLKGQVMGKEMVIVGTNTPFAGNTGNGLVTAFALSATGAPAKVGSYVLKCIDAEAGDGLSATSSAVTGTGNGTVTSLTAALPVKQGAYVLTCIDESVNDVIAVGSVTGPTGTGNGTLTELAVNALGAPAKKGTWTVTCIETITNGGRFQLADPDGVIVASDILIAAGAGGVIVFTGAGLTFKITDGSTDFVAADVFTFPVTGLHGGRFELVDPDGVIVDSRIDIASGAGGVIVSTAGGLTFTLTDGSTDFANADYFTITVAGAHGGRFELTGPDGSIIDNNIQLPGTTLGTVVFTGAGMTFTLNDGSTDFILDDYFTLTVTAGTKLVPVTDAATTNGSDLALYVLAEAVDATSGDISGVSAYHVGDFDAQQLSFEGTATLATSITIGNVAKTIREWLNDTGIIAIDTAYPDGYENT